MRMKKVLDTVALSALLATPFFGFTNNSDNVHAASMYLAQNNWHGSWENRIGIAKWHATPSKTYMRHGRWIVKGKIRTYKKGHHTFMVKPVFDGPGKIIGMDGNKHVSNSTITRALNKQVRTSKSHRTTYKYGYYKHGRYHSYKTGYFRNGKWVKKHQIIRRKAVKRIRYHTHDGKSPFYNSVEYGMPNPTKREINQVKRYYKKINNAADNNASNNPQKAVKKEIRYINQDRAEHGKSPLRESNRLDKIAQMGAQKLANGGTFGHKDTKTGYWYSSEDAYKLGYISSPNEALFGENADAGDTTPYDANNSLYTKEASYDGGHYQNIISEYPDENYTDVGVGVATNKNSEYGTYWVEDFINRNYNNDFNNSRPSSNDSSNSYSGNSDNDLNNGNQYTVNDSSNNSSISHNYSYSNNNNNNNNFGGHSYSYSYSNGNTNINNNYNG